MITTTIQTVNEDAEAATIEVTASAGEFNGIVVETKTGTGTDGHYTLTELTQDQARALIAALQASVDYYAELEAL